MYKPVYALRWSDSGDISGGLATKTYSPNECSSVFAEYEEDEISDDGEVDWGCTASNFGVNSFLINNHSNNDMSLTNRTIYFAYVIFHEADFTGGQGLSRFIIYFKIQLKKLVVS